MEIKLVKDKISKEELMMLAKDSFGNLVKAVVDVQAGIIAIGGELHADEEAVLLEQGSRPADLWGINLYPEIQREEWIEFDSLINIRPSQGNLSRGIEDVTIRQKIVEVVNSLVE